MPLRWFICPDNTRIEFKDCLKEGGCRMGSRCASRSYLHMVSQDRVWTGKPSCTQLIQGTMCAFLKITKDYAVSPDDRAFAIHGTKGHKNLENAGADDEYSELEMRFKEGDISGIADAIEKECGRIILSDTKTSGSFKVAKALGIVIKKEETGEVYKSGKRKGEPKMRNVMVRDESAIDRWEWEYQTNFYRMEYERVTGKKIDEIRIMCVVRDGNTYIARGRGVFRNVYYFNIPIMEDNAVKIYFQTKKLQLFKALKQGYWNDACDAKENWDGVKCSRYCEVAEYCKYGKYLKIQREVEEMAIKNLSEVRRLPRLGKIRLGIKKLSAKGKEYPAEVDYFILDPQTPIETENKKLIDAFHKLYGDKPKQINIMFPVADKDIFFAQFYKRYGSGASLKCKGDGVIAHCGTDEFAKGLKVTGKSDLGLPIVECHGKECPFYQSKQCSEVGTLQVLLPELPGAGVWQIATGSFHSIVNINSCIDYIRAVAGRAHMLPLKLERREQEIAYEGKKSKHYILHINMDFALADLQKFALIDPSKVLLELPEPAVTAEDIEVLPGGVEVVNKNTGEVTDPADTERQKPQNKVEQTADDAPWDEPSEEAETAGPEPKQGPAATGKPTPEQLEKQIQEEYANALAKYPDIEGAHVEVIAKKIKGLLKDAGYLGKKKPGGMNYETMLIKSMNDQAEKYSNLTRKELTILYARLAGEKGDPTGLCVAF